MAFQEFTPIEYLKIDVATNFGLNKEDWDPRLLWVNDNLEDIKTLVRTIGENKTHPLMKKAEEPALFYAGAKALVGALDGKPTNYPISLDATASGAQLMAALMKCEKSASLCNVIDAGSRKDYYTENYRLYNEAADTSIEKSRGEMKDAIMPWFYGSEKEPQKIFGKGTPEMELFHDVMEQNSPGIYMLRSALMQCWNSTVLAHEWVLPDNFHVKVKVESVEEYEFIFMDTVSSCSKKVNKPAEKGIKNAANGIHSVDAFVVREMGRRCDFDTDVVTNALQLWLNTPVGKDGEFISDWQEHNSRNAVMVRKLAELYRESGFLSARILDYIDEESIVYAPRKALRELLATMPDAPFKILSVHDCFRCHANYGNDLRRQYNQILHDIAKSDLLLFIVQQIMPDQTYVPSLGLDPNEVLESNYALS